MFLFWLCTADEVTWPCIWEGVQYKIKTKTTLRKARRIQSVLNHGVTMSVLKRFRLNPPSRDRDPATDLFDGRTKLSLEVVSHIPLPSITYSHPRSVRHICSIVPHIAIFSEFVHLSRKQCYKWGWDHWVSLLLCLCYCRGRSWCKQWENSKVFFIQIHNCSQSFPFFNLVKVIFILTMNRLNKLNL